MAPVAFDRDCRGCHSLTLPVVAETGDFLRVPHGLTLREVCGLTTEEIARAYLTPASTLALLGRAATAGPAISTVCQHIHAQGSAHSVRQILGVLALARKHGAAVVDDAAEAARSNPLRPPQSGVAAAYSSETPERSPGVPQAMGRSRSTPCSSAWLGPNVQAVSWAPEL